MLALRDETGIAGRARELEDITTTPGLLVYSGPPGSGRSALLAEAGRRARTAGRPVLAARCTDAARTHAFGVALLLVGPELAAAARTAAGVTAAPDRLGRDDRLALVRGLTGVLLAQPPGLLLTVDDAHLADAPSLAVLAQLAGAPGLTVVATTAIPVVDDDLATLVRAAGGHRPLPPLDAADAAAVVWPLLGDGRTADRVVVAAAGNPFLLTALATAVAAGEATSSGDPVPAAVRTRVADWIGGLGDDAGELATALAVLGRPSPLGLVAATAGLPLEAADRGAEVLAASGLIEGGTALAFAQPLAARAAVAAASDRSLARLHARAAELLHVDGAPPAEVAEFLLGADRLGRGWAVEALLAAAVEARLARDPERAVALGRRALEEPPDAQRRAEVVRELARAEADGGLPEAADRLREALRLASSCDDRARLSLRLGQVLMVGGDRAGAVAELDAALAAEGEIDPAIADELRAAQTVSTVNDLAVPVDARVAALARLSPDYAGPFERSALAVEAMTGTFLLTLDHLQAVALCRRALAGGALLSEETAGGVTLRFVTGTLAVADALDEGLAVTEELLAQERGGRLGAVTARYSRSWQLYYAGRVPEAIEAATEVLEEAPRDWAYMPPARALLGLALLERDEPDRAAQAVALEPRPAWRASILWPLLMAAQARVAVGRGEAAEAAALIAELRSLEELTGGHNPALLDTGAIDTLVRLQLGDGEGARTVATRDVELAARWGAPRAVGVSLRSLALATLEVDAAEAVALLERSRAVLESSPSLLERARTLVELGAARRRAGERRAAREPLAQGLHLADELGLVLVARRAREELALAGARPRRSALAGVPALTPAELRVATLAARGRTNRAIAAELFVTVKAVEKHLGATYDKLGIRSRRELAAHLLPDPA